ncbi:hypothetical protein OG379_41165 (plasmid) [Streptomyces sp. NBC_01166]|uniref:hypothetical protein n=1 Tax=Streptomyces sp. NBC_01166 TaxID=2903755 RepID=UPI0038656F42|nr:hypothetical protein OG379_41165 [Streptomyces sp. NBC_01166]
MYFSSMPHAENVDTDQLEALRDFKISLQQQGLLGQYSSLEDLKIQVISHLNSDVGQLESTWVDSNSAGAGTVPVIRVNREMLKAGQDRLTVVNIGTATADEVSSKIIPGGKGRTPEVIGTLEAEHLDPGDSISAVMVVAMGVAPTAVVVTTFKFQGNSYMKRTHLNLF